MAFFSSRQGTRIDRSLLRVGRRVFKRRKQPVAAFLLFCLACALCGELIRNLRSWNSGQESVPLSAMSLASAGTKFGEANPIKSEHVAELLYQVKLEPVSSLSGPVAEPPLAPHMGPSIDPEKYGEGNSQFLVDSRWATVRFIGPNPAGAGLTGAALNKAQMDALGNSNDTIPVITAAITINEMMDKFFSPLLSSLAGGKEILEQIKVQGAYFSPEYNQAERLDSNYDNAFIYNLQTLLIYPNSCFKEQLRNSCKKPFFSTGHDPTVMGHELGHVIFNHMRSRRSLEGFQWFAVNEGFADYFSASYFSEPVLGRIWRANASGDGYLRRLLDTPTTENPKFLQEGHLFGVIFSSALWRARQRLMAEYQIPSFEIDRVYLQSIVYLGETEKARLADAATAILKAAETLGHSEWKKVLREEFDKAEISMTDLPSFSLNTQGSDIAFGKTASAPATGCGVVANQSTDNAGSGKKSAAVALLLLLCPLVFFRVTQKTNLRLCIPGAIKYLLFLLFFFLRGCNISWLFPSKESAATAPGTSLLYTCFPNLLDNPQSGTAPENRVDLTLSWLPSDSPTTPTQHVLVSDLRYDRAPSALVIILDKDKHHVDQVRTRKGNIFEIDMTAKNIPYEDAVAYSHMRLAELLLQKSVVASTDEKALKSALGKAEFDSHGRRLQADISRPLYGANSYGPLPLSVSFKPTQAALGGTPVPLTPVCAFVRKDEPK